MNFKVFLSMAGLLGLGFFLVDCSTAHYDIESDPTESHHFVTMKVFCQGEDFKFSGKALLKYKDNHDIVYLLTPFNQVVFKMYLTQERVTLLNLKKKTYWQGSFAELFFNMTLFEMSIDELKQLITEGKIPNRLKEQTDINTTVKNSPRTSQPELIEMFRPGGRLRFKILQRQKRSGKINFDYDLTGFVNHDLAKTLTMDQ